MTYDARESSTESGNPVELYEFNVGSTTYRYTSSELAITAGGYSWTPENLRRTRVSKTTHASEDKIQIALPADAALARIYKLVSPGYRVTATIYRLHRDDGNVVTYAKGFMHAAGFNDNGRTALFAVLPITSAKNRQIPRFTFSGLCNYDLFDVDCKVSESSYTHDLPVTAVTDDVLTATGAGALGSDYFVNGFVVWNGEYRTIIAQSTNDLTLLVPFTTTPLGQTLSFRAGCKKRLSEDCHTKFGSNELNHGGFEFVPWKNPFETGLD